MMTFNVISLFPECYKSFQEVGVIGKAFDKKIAELNIINPRDFAVDKHKSVDAPPFGGGDGMLMMASPLEEAIKSIKWSDKVVYLSPQGRPWTSAQAKAWSFEYSKLTIICGRYAGIDQRVVNRYVDAEVSIGDFVISGGEIASQVMMDSIMRYLPGTLGDVSSAYEDTFSDGLLEAPQFTQPREVLGQKVPEVLLSGHHKNIKEWKSKVALATTYFRRNDLIKKNKVQQKDLLNAFQWLSDLSEDELAVIGFLDQEIYSLSQLAKGDFD